MAREKGPRKSELSNRKATPKTTAKSPKRRRFVKGLIEGKSMRRAALDAGFTQSMADKAGEKIFPNARAEFQDELSKAVPIARLVARIAKGLDAKETKLASFEGSFEDSRDMIAWGERRHYAELAAKLLGFLVSKVELTGEGGGPIELTDAHERLLAKVAR
jgi:hypothetical protein